MNNLFGYVPLINISISVTARGNDFDLSIRNGTYAANKPDGNGEYPFNSVHHQLSRLGIDPSGVKLLGGGEVTAYPHYAVTHRLHYSITRQSLPPVLKAQFRDFHAAQRVPEAVPYINL